MAKKFQKQIKIKIPKGYTERERKIIGEEMVQRIIERSREERKDKNGETFAGYSEQYAQSLDGRNAGKRKNAPANLTLTGEMLDSLSYVKSSDGELVIGYKKGTPPEVLARAEGNITGQYGKNKAKPRDFMGLTKEERDEILSSYPIEQLENLNRRQRAEVSRTAERIQSEAGRIAGATVFDPDLDDIL